MELVSSFKQADVSKVLVFKASNNGHIVVRIIGTPHTHECVHSVAYFGLANMSTVYKQWPDMIQYEPSAEDMLFASRCVQDAATDFREALNKGELIDLSTLSVRTANVLKAGGILHFSTLYNYGRDVVFKIPNMGRKSMKELDDYLISTGRPSLLA